MALPMVGCRFPQDWHSQIQEITLLSGRSEAQSSLIKRGLQLIQEIWRSLNFTMIHEVKTETQKQQKEGKISNPQYPSNEINSVGFPEGQMLANDATPEETALISAAYLQGKPLPETGNEVLDRVSDRLTQTSGYGKYSDWGESDD